MSVNWSEYFARYQALRGGYFFGAGASYCDSQLVLTEGEKAPILVWIDLDPAGKYTSKNLKARAMVQLDGLYNLHIRARSLMGSGVTGVMNLVKPGSDFGYPEATRGRIITTDNEAFTKRVLGDLDLRNALIRRKQEHLKISPSPQREGWHVVEVGAINVEGGIKESVWVTRSMAEDTLMYSEEEKERLLRAGSEHFNAQMDEFLDFLRAARRAVTTWRM